MTTTTPTTPTPTAPTPTAPTPTAAAGPTTPRDDAAVLRRTAAFVREHDTASLLPLLLPGLAGPELRAAARHCRFAHAALLVFPPDQPTLHAQLAACGLAFDAPPVPSVVVRDRLARRHGCDPAALDVRILRPTALGPGRERREVEVFALTVPPRSPLAALADHERAHQHEAHLAFEVDSADPLLLRGLCALLARHGAEADGGGYNPHEDGTVLYFTVPAGSRCAYRRLELHARGEHPGVLDAHLGHQGGPRPAPRPAAGPGETLLQLFTGAWTTQALAVCARLSLPDALDRTGATTGEALARRVGADPETLAALLRYLAMLGVVSEHPDGYRLTGLGALLRADTPGSMRSLALMYGGPFYRSFEGLEHTTRTGRPAFDHLFGENHFDHFARDPELAALFDQSMAASSPMFEPLPGHPVLTAAAARASTRTTGAGTADGTADGTAPGTVVDVAGGTGELLGRVLSAHPGLRGILLERAHVVDAARRRLDDAGCGTRCTYRTGDFADVPPGADVYLLSRVLHDWDDARCREILGHCARAMPAHADLLIVERLLPDDGSASLATAWDLHMRCNTGGRERRADHYGRLLADAGLELLGHSPLPLGAAVLHARKAAAPAPARAPHRAPVHAAASSG
ncbi:methyltransferase [Kitasatospora sp. NPDC093550]|uniref:methyltransferase n=1 Tax=Kitasatospora sp. NPDC093550 TaxID=3364089 RepID=UPI0038002588